MLDALRFVSPRSRRHRARRAVVAASLLLGAASATAAVLSNDEVLARTGRTIDQWGASWWQWAFANPDVIGDTTGASASLGNVGGPVFFAEGSFGDPVTAAFAMANNRFVLLPIATYLWTFFDPCAQAACATGIVNTFADAIVQPYVTVDGVPVADLASHRVRVDPASPRVFQVDAGPIGPDGYGGILDAVESGDWVMLDPLARGTHEISFGASVPITDALTGRPLGGSMELRTDLVIASVPEPSVAVMLASCGLFVGVAAARRADRRGRPRSG